MSLKFLPAAVALAALGFAGQPAFADTASEDQLRAWVEAIDASPSWTAKFIDITSEGSQTTLHGLEVDSESPGVTLTVDTISVSDLSSSDDGSFAASEATATGIAIHAGIVSVALDSVDLKDFSLPAINLAVDRTKPFQAMLEIMRPLNKVKLASATIGSMVVTEVFDTVDSEVTYGPITLSNWADGRIASMSAGQITSRSPKADPLIDMSIGGLESRDINLDAMLAVLDPDRYAGGVGDRVWRTVVGHAAYRDFKIKAPGADTSIASITLDDLHLRQPRGGIQPLYDISASMSGTITSGHNAPPPAAMPDPLTLIDLLSIYGFGKFDLSGLDVSAIGVDSFHLGSMTMNDVSSDGIGEFAIGDFNTTVTGQGTVKLGRFAFGGVVFPPIEALIAAARAQETDANLDVTSITPKIGFVEMKSLNVALTTAPQASLDSVRADFKNYVGPVPTAVTFDLAGADIAVDQIDDAKARKTFTDLGYDRVRMNAAVDIDWSAAGDIVFNSFRFAVDDLGEVTGDLTLTGITPASVDHLDPDTVLDKLSFVKGSLTFKDNSIVGRGLDMQAKQLKTDPAKFRQQFALGVPLMLTFLGDQNLQQQLAPALQTLITTTAGSITATALPGAPVPLAALAEAADAQPFALLKQLSVKFTSQAGTPPSAN